MMWVFKGKSIKQKMIGLFVTLISALTLISQPLAVFGGESIPEVLSVQTNQTAPKPEVISLGVFGTFVIDEQGDLWGWGEVTPAVGGVQEGISYSKPHRLFTGVNYKLIARDNHCGAIDGNGKLWMWGHGYLGDGVYETKNSPVNIMPEKRFKSVDVTQGVSGAVDSDGLLWMWGDNWYGTIGNGKKQADYQGASYGPTELYPVNIKPEKRFSKVSLGLQHSGAIAEDGSLWMWGLNSDGSVGCGMEYNIDDDCVITKPINIMPGTKFKDLSLGSHSGAIDEEGRLWMWGYNSNGEVGNGKMFSDYLSSKAYEPVPVNILPELKFKSISLDGDVSGAIDEEGRLWMWGVNEQGQVGCGLDRGDPIITPVNILSDIRFSSVSVSNHFCGAIDTEGRIWMWGLNTFGQIGNGKSMNDYSSTAIEATPIQVSFSDNTNEDPSGDNNKDKNDSNKDGNKDNENNESGGNSETQSPANNILKASDNKPMAVSTETIKGDYRVEYPHQIPFPGKGKITPELFGDNFTVSQGSAVYKVKKIKVNKKKRRIQITGLEGADKPTEKAVKKATKGDKGIPYECNPYYVRDTDKVTIKFKGDGSIKSLKVFINGKDYKTGKDEYDYNKDTKVITFKGNNLAGSYTAK